MADAPVTVPVKLVQDGNIGIHTDGGPVGIQITHVNDLVDEIVNNLVQNHKLVESIHPHLHCLQISLIIVAVFLALILIVMTVSLVISAIALHKIAKQGELELELEELN